MYPAHYYNLFPAFPQTSRVFVAMSFAEQFKARYENVIAKAIRNIQHNNVVCEPLIVNARTVSDSILTEILEGIRSSFLVFADITTIERLGDHVIRNSNVMYEVGIAHAVRLPEEVILFRSDDDRLPFDTTNVRVNRYDPDNKPDDAFKAICDAIINASKEIDLRRHMSVEKAAGMLDHPSWGFLEQMTKGAVKHPRETLATLGDQAAISKLLELGLIQMRIAAIVGSELIADPTKLKDPMTEYRITPFGRAVIAKISADIEKAFRSLSPEEFQRLRQLLAEESSGPPGP